MNEDGAIVQEMMLRELLNCDFSVFTCKALGSRRGGKETPNLKS